MRVCGSCLWWYSPPPPPLFCGLGGGSFSALSCRGFVVSVAGCPGLRGRGLRPPFPSRLGCAFVFFFGFFCSCFCPSLPERGLCWRVRGVLSSCGPLLSVGCRRFWLGGPPVFLWGAPVGAVFGVVWLGGLPASCGVGGRLRGSGPVSCLAPPFFWGGVCLFLPLPSLGWCNNMCNKEGLQIDKCRSKFNAPMVCKQNR